ncbi:MAG: signal peptide peptidase SppA [Bacteroidales bacterium]|nr:signal peptide peptidase SppA [Bacteroidales bacterium]
MKNFFKAVLATMVGLILLWTLLFFTILTIGIASFTTSQPIVKSNSLLELDLNGIIKDRTIDNPFEQLYGNNAITTIGLNHILSTIKYAESDNNIKGISLYVCNIQSSYASIEEIRNALIDFRKTGKFVYCYSETMSQKAYYLATASDSIFIHPQGSIELKGIAAEVLFFNKLLDKLNIEAQIIRHGEYKSAIEPFILDKMSAANREQMEVYLNSTWENISSDICNSRNIDEAKINTIADNLSVLYNIPLSLQENFIDGIAYQDEYESFLKTKLQVEKSREINKISLSDYQKTIQAQRSTPNQISVIYAVGNIIDDKGDYENIGQKIAQEISKARQEKTIKAVVLRVNSGGGSALMSDIIWKEVMLTKEIKPIIVSMGDYAASGGYYISCAANYIVAQPSTLTGSIGVFGLIPNIDKFLSTKLGITTDQVKTNTFSDAISITRPMKKQEKEILQKGIENIYDTFINRVAEGRNLTVEEVDKIAQGRVWTGSDAMKIGLVDTLGGLDLAIKIAAKKANLKNYSINEKPIIKDFFEQFTAALLESKVSQKINILKSKNIYQYFDYIETLTQLHGIQARIPFIITIE